MGCIIKNNEPSTDGIAAVFKSVFDQMDVKNDGEKKKMSDNAVVPIEQLSLTELYVMIEQHKLHLSFFGGYCSNMNQRQSPVSGTFIPKSNNPLSCRLTVSHSIALLCSCCGELVPIDITWEAVEYIISPYLCFHRIGPLHWADSIIESRCPLYACVSPSHAIF